MAKGLLLARMLFFLLWFLTTVSFAQDPNVHIYLALGQSNMAGQSMVTDKDRIPDPRFFVLRAADHSMQLVGEFYPAAPPMAHSGSWVGIADMFGRAMVASLPDSIKVVVANVAIGGQSIDLFDKDRYQDYVQRMKDVGNTWWMPYLDEYGGNLYKRLVEMGEIAKRKGVIKGILFHQGEADAHMQDWPSRVKKVHQDLMTDLNLDPMEVPFLIGEFVTTEEGGDMGWRNPVVAEVAKLIPNGHLISAKGCPGLKEKGGVLHFTREGYEMLGKRYAQTMITLLENPNPPRNEISFSTPIAMRMIGKNLEVIGAPDDSRIRLFDVQGNLLAVLGPKGGMVPHSFSGRVLVTVESLSGKRLQKRLFFLTR